MGCFTTKDGFIVVAAFNQNFWRNLCRGIGREDWITDERYRGMADRARNQDEIFEELDQILSTKTTAEWEAIFAHTDVPFGPVWGIADLMRQPNVAARGLLEPLAPTPSAPDGQGWSVAVRPVKYSGFDSGVTKQPPALGEDTAQVLEEMLQLSPEQIRELSDRGVVGLRPSA
jgi:crotonobetainyl-CoA:carnitine CoA-transferase CaiB-like acyl-CoA transferase